MHLRTSINLAIYECGDHTDHTEMHERTLKHYSSYG